jgi:hypothetical protein
MFRAKIKPLTLAVTLAGLGPTMLSGPLYAAAIQEKVTAAPGKTITPREEATLSSAGVKVLRHIAQARADIRNKETQDAKTELGQTEKLLDIIQAALPTTVVKDRIWVAKKHLEYENTQEVLPDLIPIYASLDELVDIMPTDMAKKHLDQAKEHLKSGNKEKAKEALEATAAALQYTEVDLPLNSTRQMVDQAKADLSKEKSDNADKALKAAEDSVVYLSVAYDQPLFTAKALLWQAVLDLDASNKELAKSDLQGAIGYLEMARQSSDQATQDAAKQILVEAKELQKDLESGADVGTRLRYLWERTHALADRSMEYIAAGWARYRAENPLKSDLIEAKLHLANARIDFYTGHDADKAKEELSVAQGFLDQAAENTKKQKVEEGYQKRIAEVQTAVQKLNRDPAAAKESRYDVLQHQLRSMIQSL